MGLQSDEKNFCSYIVTCALLRPALFRFIETCFKNSLEISNNEEFFFIAVHDRDSEDEASLFA